VLPPPNCEETSLPSTSSPTLLSTPSVQLSGEGGSILVSRPGPAVVLLRVAGRVDDLTDALSHELEADLVIQGALHLFIQARTSSLGADVLGSPRWAHWFRSHRAHLARVTVLVSPGFLKATGDLARGFAGLDGKLEILFGEDAFMQAQKAALRSPTASGTFPCGEREGEP